MSDVLASEIIMKKIKSEGNHVVIHTYKNHFWDLDLQEMTFKKYDNNDFSEEDETNREFANQIKIDNSLIYMNELNIMICDNKDKYTILPKTGYRFLGIASVNGDQSKKLIVLSGSNDNVISVLTSYFIG